jgi:O-succinylbenzoate synthase
LGPVKVDAVELRRARMALVAPWRTSYGTETERDILLVRVAGEAGEGWAECGALSAPGYVAEWVGSAHEVLRTVAAPRLVGGPSRPAAGVAALVPPGHPMAAAALETAVLDAELRAAGTSLAAYLGATRTRVPAGVAVGIVDPLGALLDAVDAFAAKGYVRVKLKIEPGRDVDVVRAVRERFPDLPLQVDANGAYPPGAFDDLVALDAFGLLLVEQPFAAGELAAHAELARRSRTPVCLDESIGSAADASHAIAMGACSVVNVKAPRVGGYLEAKRVHDVCVDAGVPVWCGGMLETGLGRAGNVALAALPGFTLPGDLSASDRYYGRDLTEPFVLDDGHLAVPQAPGVGGPPLASVLAEVTTSVESITA